MRVTVLKPIKRRTTGEKFFPKDVIDLPEEKAREWAEKGLVSIGGSDPLPERVDWESPVFGKLSGGPVLEMTETTFSLVHPVTEERATISREWLVTMEERAAILEYEAGLPRKEADRQARGMLFNQFRKKGKP